MAVTRLSDAIVPEVFFPYMQVETQQKMAFYDAGVLSSDAALGEKLSGGGRTFNVPFWKDLDDTESDVASDDPASDAVPAKIGSAQDIARRQIRTRGWSSARLVRELAGDDPMKAISGRVSDYWARQFDDIAIASVRGVIADNVANDSGDMVNDIATDSASAETAAEWVSAEAVMDAAQTLGDKKSDLKLIVMHSVVQTRLAKLDLIDFRPDSYGTSFVPHYLDYRVHASDKVPAVAGSNRVTYHTYLFGEGALGWAESPVERPVSVDTDESAADGMGVDELWTRRQICIHPYGIKFTDASVTAEFPTNTELRTAANWDRVYPERKQIPIAVLKTNG